MKKKIILGTIISLVILISTPIAFGAIEKFEQVKNSGNNGYADDFYYEFFRPKSISLPLCCVAVSANNYDGKHYGEEINYKCYLKVKIPGIATIANVSQAGSFFCFPKNNRDMFIINGPSYREFFKKGGFFGHIDMEFNIHILNDDSHHKVLTRGTIIFIWTLF